MKKIIIIAVLVTTSAITALSFNKKNDETKAAIKIEKSKLADKDHSAPKMDISTID